ncbi:DUF4056 domain-containing protein, partial [Vibrio parahaemolyticus]|nr:DUF4056 domain-containing protein [Vibrio parahaemolyticus]
VDKSQSKLVLAAVDGKWWNSHESIPNKYMVLQRNYDLGDIQKPHRLTPELLGKENSNLQYLAQSPAIVLTIPASVESLDLDNIAKLVLEVAPSYADTFNHIPKRIWSERIEHTQFPVIAKYAELQDGQEMKALDVTEK